MSLTTESQEQSTLEIPPAPPAIFKKGNFDYVVDTHSRAMILSAYNAINTLELWNEMKKYGEPEMTSVSPAVSRIYQKIEEQGYCGHSGCSFGWTMHIMQMIAEDGERQFMAEWIRQTSK